MLAQRFCRVKFVHIFPPASFAKSGEAFVSAAGGLSVEQVHLSPAVAEVMVPALSQGARVIIEVPHPAVLPVMQAAKTHGIEVVVEILDDWFDPALGGDWFDREALAQMLAIADRVVATALPLKLQAEQYFNGTVEYLPNAANELEFRPKPFREGENPRPVDIPGRPHRVALYLGSLHGSWLRWDFIQAAAAMCPDTAFVIVGDATPEIMERNRDYANIHLVGLKRHSELAPYAHAASVGLLPFAPGPLLEAMSPVKVFEYGFAGLPVVATSSEELKGLPFLHQVSTAEQFAALSCADLPLPSLVELSSFLQTHSWGRVVDAIMAPHKLKYSFAVIALCHNNAGTVERFVRSALAHSAGKALVQVIVVDTASTDHSPQVLLRLKEELGITVVMLDDPGASRGRNAGVAAISMGGTAEEDALVAFFDSDFLVTSASWMFEAAAIHASNPGLGAVGWTAGWFSPDTLPRGPTCHTEPRRGANDETDRLGYRESIGFLGSAGMVAKLAAVRATPGFDEQLSPAGLEDADLSFELREAGYSIAYRQFAGLLRHASQPADTLREDASASCSAVVQQARKRLLGKWKHRPEYYVALE